MESKADSLLLSYEGNDSLKAALGGLQPGDQAELCITVTVRANDDKTFDAIIDEVEADEMDDMDEAMSEEEPDDTEGDKAK